MKISVIIPAYNEEKDIGECLKSLESQTFKNFEIIVVDDGSKDKTLEVVKKFKKVRLIPGKHKGPGFSRNLGAKKARGEILVFVDADMTFDKDYIKNLIKPVLNNKKIIGSTHELELVKNTTNVWSRCWGKIRVSKEDEKNVKIFRAIRKKKFLELGGFDPKYGYADDQTFWLKYKIRPIVAENTICYHKNPGTLKEVYKQSRWIGASLDSIWLNIPILNYVSLFGIVILSPLMIPVKAIRKSIVIKDMKILFPWMIVFMAMRYFGTVSGIFRKIHFGGNSR